MTMMSALNEQSRRWYAEGKGFLVQGGGDDGAARINHFMWAGSIYLVGATKVELQDILRGRYESAAENGLDWKEQEWGTFVAGRRRRAGDNEGMKRSFGRRLDWATYSVSRE